MRTSFLLAALLASVPASAGDIDMNLTNQDQVIKAQSQQSGAPSSSGGQPGKPAPGNFKAIDEALAQASAAVKDLEAVLEKAEGVMRASAQEKPMGYRDMYLAKIEGDCKAAFRPTDVPAASADPRLLAASARYLACQALALGQPAVCGSVGTKVRVETPATGCTDAYYLVKFAQAKIAGGDAAAVCRAADKARGGDGAACAAAAAGQCESFRGMAWLPFDELEPCKAVFAAIAGKPNACAGYKGETPGYGCADIAALRNKAACPKSALCTAANGGRLESCLPLLRDVGEQHCRSITQNKAKNETAIIDAAAKDYKARNPAPRTAAMNEVTAKRREVDAILVGIGAALDGFEPKDKVQYPQRFTRYREIRKNVDGALKRFGDATGTAPVPKKKPAADQ